MAAAPKQMRQKCTAWSMIHVGLQVHEEVRATRDAGALGIHLRFDTGVAAVDVVNLRNATEHADVVLRRSGVTKRLPRCWNEGPCRSCLPATKLVRAADWEPRQTWRCVQEELETFSFLVPFLETILRLPKSEI